MKGTDDGRKKEIERLAECFRKAAGAEFVDLKKASEISGINLHTIRKATRLHRVKYSRLTPGKRSKIILHVSALAEWVESLSNPAK